ncbi:MAG: class B sortase [Clostridia bacterium]|nr:class B sortase [Clostridia bacterium]
MYLYKCTPMFHRNSGIAPGAESVGPPETVVVPDDTGTGETAEPELPKNPVNFSKQMEINDEIYAWIYVPNTNVNYPILQSRVDDLYYLRRGLDKEYDISGVVFTQSHNKRDFSDPVTLIYGHNMTEYGTMFATLHNFEDEEFFKENDTFYIYAPGHIYTYKIVSAYRYDDRHIMNSFDFTDKEVVKEYFDYVMHPTMIPMNVREGVELKEDDRLVVLSTCMADNTYRYLVNGVLISDEKTK